MQSTGTLKQKEKDLMAAKKKPMTIQADSDEPVTHRTTEANSMKGADTPEPGQMTDEQWHAIKAKGTPTDEEYQKRYAALLNQYHIKSAAGGAMESQADKDPSPAPAATSKDTTSGDSKASASSASSASVAKKSVVATKNRPVRMPVKGPNLKNRIQHTTGKSNKAGGSVQQTLKSGTSDNGSHRAIEEASMKTDKKPNDASKKNWANNNRFNGGSPATSSSKPKGNLRNNIYSGDSTKRLTISGGTKGSWQKNNRFSDEDMKKKKGIKLPSRDYTIASVRRDYFERDTEKAGF